MRLVLYCRPEEAAKIRLLAQQAHKSTSIFVLESVLGEVWRQTSLISKDLNRKRGPQNFADLFKKQ